MNSITLKKPSGEKFQVNDRRSESKQVNNFQVNTRAGYVGSPAEDKMMLPMGYSLQDNGKVETPLERQKRLMKKQENQKPKQMEDEMLLPVGINLED